MTRYDVDKDVFVRALESVQPAVAQRETVEQSSCFVFQNNRVFTYDDERACSVPQPFGEGDGITGAVKAEKLLETLSKMTAEKIRVAEREGEIVISALGEKVDRAGLFVDQDIVLPTGAVDVPEGDQWKSLHPRFAEAVGVVQECAKTDGQFQHTVISVTPRWIEACDLFQLCRWKMKTRFKLPNTLVRKESVRHVVSMGMTEFAETESWVHFRNADGLVMSIRRFEEEFGDYSDYLEVDGESTNLPKGFVDKSAMAKVFSSDNADKKNDRVTVEINPAKGGVRLSSRGTSGWYKSAWYPVKYRGDPLAFMISPAMLASLVDKHSEFVLSPGRLGIVTEDYTYLAWLVDLSEPQGGEANGHAGPRKKRREESPAEEPAEE